MTTEPEPTTLDSGGVARRELLSRGLLMGGAGVVASALVGSTAATLATARPAAAGTATLVIDVACLGETLRMIAAPGSMPPGDLAGSVFSIEGNIYPAGTIPEGDGFDPSSARPIGHSFLRGWLINTPARPQPAALFIGQFVFGELTPEQLFPPDQLMITGMGQSIVLPGFDPTQLGLAAVFGGTGRYAGAAGEVVFTETGVNTTGLAPAGLMGQAPNSRFELHLR